MKPKQKRGAKLQILKRCCPRVKCFIDTDAGFNPIPSKTDLAPQHRFTNALKVLGDDHQKEKGVKVQISKDGKQLTLQQLEREYQDWIFLMHSLYDDEGNLGDDELVLLVTASNKESLGVTSDGSYDPTIRFYRLDPTPLHRSKTQMQGLIQFLQRYTKRREEKRCVLVWWF